jgi:hypothetical protein
MSMIKIHIKEINNLTKFADIDNSTASHTLFLNSSVNL